MKLKMLNRCHIFQFLDNLKKDHIYYENWVKKDKEVLETLLQRVETEINNCKSTHNEPAGYTAKVYDKTNIEFFIKNLASYKKYFDRVARLTAKICKGYVDEKNNFKIYKIQDNKNDGHLTKWVLEFAHMFVWKVDENNVGVLRKIALEYIISNFGDGINVFELLFLLKKEMYTGREAKKLTALDKEISKKLVDKIIKDKFGEGYCYNHDNQYQGLGKYGKINFVSQILQAIGLEIHAEEKKRLYNELRKQRKQEQKNQWKNKIRR